MMFTTVVLVLFLSFVNINALYIPSLSHRCGADCPCATTANATEFVTADQLIQIDNATASCDPNATFASECRNATEAAPYINKAFTDYNITSIGEQAALLSLMMFETGGLKFDRNHFPEPGTPGQGTRSLMSFPFVLEYALDTPLISPAAQALVGENATAADVDDDTKNLVRELVLGDDLSFASTMWFYDSASEVPCRQNTTIAEGLQAETKEGWETYLTGCIFTTVTEDREAVWNKTLEVLKGSDSEALL